MSIYKHLTFLSKDILNIICKYNLPKIEKLSFDELYSVTLPIYSILEYNMIYDPYIDDYIVEFFNFNKCKYEKHFNVWVIVEN